MKKGTKDGIIGFVIVVVLVTLAFASGWLIRAKKEMVGIAPLESYLVLQVDDPNWIINYGVELDSRLVYNVALLNQVVNRQGIALKQLLEDPNR